MVPFVRQAWQSWRSAKAVAFLVVLALSVGIGSATAIYTAINTLLLKPAPYTHGERWVSVLGGSRDDPGSMSSLSTSDVLEYQRRARSFDVFGWMRYVNYNLTAPGQPLYLNAVLVTPGLANSVGVNPRIGQWFRDAAAPAAVISHGLWQRLGGDPRLPGKTIVLNGHAYTVTGIMPPGFELPLAGVYGEANIDAWLPLDPSGRGHEEYGDNFGYARLRPGVTTAQADAEVKRIAEAIAKREPATRRNYTARADGLGELVSKEIRPVLLLLFTAAELLLLIACANIGGLLLARSVVRARETAVRVALGARLRQLAGQYFVEGLMVCIPGALGGLLLSAAVVKALVSLAGPASPRAGEIGMDWRVAMFALATAVLASALTAVAPLWQAGRTQPNEILSEGVRASAGSRSRRLAQSLVAAEIALAFVLLVVSGIFVSELYRLNRVWPGFDPARLLTFRLSFTPETVPGKASRVSYEKRLVETMEAIPGVNAAAFANQLPLKGCCYTTAVFVPGASSGVMNTGTLSFISASPHYLRAMAIPLRRGRFPDERDTNEKVLAVALDEKAAKTLWPDRDPVGAFGHFNKPDGDLFQVVGVVGDVKNNGLDNGTRAEIYLPSVAVPVNPMDLVVRSRLPPAALVRAVRQAIRNVNPGQPIYDVKMMGEVVQESLTLKRVASYVMTFFGLAALLMAMLGAYGVISYSVRQRTVEIGTRMALGATTRHVLRLVAGSGMKIAAYGIAIGGAVAAAASWLLLRNFEIAVGNGGFGRLENPGALPFLAAGAVVAAVALASSLFPAWSATLLSPMVAIRNEPESMWEAARRGIGRLFEGFSGAESGAPGAAEATAVTGLIEASRRAASFREALEGALESLLEHSGAQWAALLENVPGEEYRVSAAVPRCELDVLRIPKRGLLLSRFRAYSAPLPITAGDLETWRRWAAEYQPAHIAEVEALRNCGARMAVPLRTGKDVFGLLVLGELRRPFGAADRQWLRSYADQLALMLENARLTDRMVEEEKLRRDLALAAEVQRRLLAQQSAETAAAWLAAVNLPARSVGGDYYDFFSLGADRTGIALADVAGKGVAAALIMSVVQATLRVVSSEPGMDLPRLVEKMNHFLYRSTGPQSYATFFCAELEAHTRMLRYVNGGHNPPYLLRIGAASREMEELAIGGTVVGMFPRAQYEEGVVELRAGDVLLVFTDGVPEALNPRDEEFGEERLRDLLRRVAGLPVEEMSARILRELKDWIQDAAQYDDLTYVVMKVK